METEGEIIRVLWVHGKVVITKCKEKQWYNNALVSNWGRNWISTLRLLPYTHTQKFKLKFIKESKGQNKVLTPLEKYKRKYIYASGFPKAANSYSVVADAVEQAKGSAFTIQFLAVCSHGTKKNLKLWLVVWDFFFFYSEILIEKCDDLESSSAQDATRQMGLRGGDKTMNTILVGTPVLVQQDLQSAWRRITSSLPKNAHFQPSFHDSDSLCWVPPRTCTFIPIQVLLMQVVHGPQFEKHCSRSSDTGTHLEEPYTHELTFLYFNINFASLNLAP